MKEKDTSTETDTEIKITNTEKKVGDKVQTKVQTVTWKSPSNLLFMHISGMEKRFKSLLLRFQMSEINNYKLISDIF